MKKLVAFLLFALAACGSSTGPESQAASLDGTYALVAYNGVSVPASGTQCCVAGSLVLTSDWTWTWTVVELNTPDPGTTAYVLETGTWQVNGGQGGPPSTIALYKAGDATSSWVGSTDGTTITMGQGGHSLEVPVVFRR